MTTKKLNPWSIVAALCAIGLCPLFSIAAVLAGIRAIVEIKAREDTCGLRLAWASILVGSILTGLWGGGLLWWNSNVRSMIEQGPIHAIIAGQAGDVHSFSEIFLHDGNPEEVATFLHSCHSRYGQLQRGSLNKSMNETAVDGTDLFLGMVPVEATLDYQLMFTDEVMVHCTAKYELFRTVEGGTQFTNRFVWLLIEDEKNGPLVYPVDVYERELHLHAE